MKKPLLALATTLLLPNMSFAAACADGANAAGCTIGTSNITYTLTGDIAPASGVIGIQFFSLPESHYPQPLYDFQERVKKTKELLWQWKNSNSVKRNNLKILSKHVKVRKNSRT